MSGYDGGAASRQSKVLKAWLPRWLSAGSDIDLNLQTMRSRAADLARNTALGSAAITASSRGVIGSGLKLFARPNHRLLGITATEAREWGQRATEEFRLWAATVDCDLNRRNNFYDLQHIAYENYLVDGDCFVLFRRKPPTTRNPYTLRLQLLEGNRVSTPYRDLTLGSIEGRAPNGNRIVNGIEVDDDGELIALHVSNRVPDDAVDRERVTEWARVEMFGRSGFPNALQICHDIRAGQYRGVPYLAPVVETLKQMAQFTTAELSAAIIKSYFALFFTQPEMNYEVQDVLGEGARSEYEELDISEYRLGTGTLTALPRGVDVKAVDSGQSTSTFGAFMDELETEIGAALGLPREVLVGSFKASYSASRAALLQANDEYQRRREWFVRDFLRPIYEVFLTEAVAIGRLDAPAFFDDALKRRAWCECEWYGPALGILDPVKEIQAATLRIEQGLSTRQKEAAELTGTNLERNLEQQMLERELLAQ